uniref:Uncharacterized protein n=1 Tax=Siphoviridae sp. ctO0R2 TaxID=2825476 RepID=A0A8S5PDD8_9CAUD|nr:MAG TPA: hypothetical protein [Siphoviridae sp. ctO0R2]
MRFSEGLFDFLTLQWFIYTKSLDKALKICYNGMCIRIGT